MLPQSVAHKLFDENGFLVVQGMPRGSYVALDGVAAVSDYGFEGYKFVPAGVHMFVWHAGSEDIGVRSVFFHRFSQGGVVLRRYNSNSDTWTCDNELVVSRDHLKTFDPHLAAYPFAQLPLWRSLTHNLEASQHVLGRCGSDEIDSFTPVGADGLKLTAFDIRRSWPADATGTERTQATIDKSWLLNRVIHSAAEGEPTHVDVLGEFELCFVLALYANNASALEHWASMNTLFCRAATRIGAPSHYALHPCEWDRDEALPPLTPPSLDAHIAYLHALAAQLASLPQEVWTDQLAEHESGLLDNLVHLQRSIGRALAAWAALAATRSEQPPEPRFADLISAWRSLCTTCQRWGWRLGAELDEEAEAESDADEDAPVVVY